MTARGAQPGLETTTNGDAVQEALETTETIASRHVESGERQTPPSIFVDSAEGVTTYAGFNGDPRSKLAKSWAAKELREKLPGFAKRQND